MAFLATSLLPLVAGMISSNAQGAATQAAMNASMSASTASEVATETQATAVSSQLLHLQSTFNSKLSADSEQTKEGLMLQDFGITVDGAQKKAIEKIESQIQ